MSFKFTPIIILCAAFLFASCSKKDSTVPVITMKGDSYITIILNTHFTDPGATASDNLDGIITVTTSDTVNGNFAGTYYINYVATDAAGNEGRATRTVVVRNEADIYNGNYNTMTILTDTSNYVASLTTSNILNKRIWLVGFSNFDNAVVYADLSNDTITIDHQLVTAGTPQMLHAFTGSGLISSISGHTVFTINFTDSVAGSIKNGTSVYTKTN